jgi:hypothetical protein
MSIAPGRAPEKTRRHVASTTSRPGLVEVLLACGVLYPLTYAVANDLVAAALYDGYSRMDQAISELSATGAPTRIFLVAMLAIWTVLMIAFGIGVRASARGKRALRVTGGLLVAFGVTGVLWLPFPMSSREDMVEGATSVNDAGHLVLSAVTVVLILAQIGFGAAAFGRRFRLYSLVTAATVVVFGALTGMQSPKVPTGEPTTWMGLFERISVGAWLLWLAVLAIVILRSRNHGLHAPAPSPTRLVQEQRE